MTNSNTHFIKISLILFLLFESHTLFAGWVQKSDLPSNGRRWSATFTIGAKGYVACGSHSGLQVTQDLWAWDQVTDTWTQMANYPGLGREGALGFAVSGKGYVVMGWDGLGYNQSNYHADMYEYDPTSNSWTQKTDMPGIGRYVGMGFAITGKIYVGMGLAAGWNYLADWYEYDPANDTWTTKTSFHIGMDLAASFEAQLKGYIVCGRSGNVVTNEVWEYNAITDTWTQKSNFPGVPRSNSIGWSLGSIGMIGMGSDVTGMTLYDEFWLYNPYFDTWSASAPFPGGLRKGGIGFSIGECAYMGNGQDSLNNEVNDLWEYCAPTAVNENAAINISVYPNPLKSNGIIYISGKVSDKADYTVYNNTGEKIAFGYVKDSKVMVPSENLSDGLFIIEIKDPVYNYQLTEKFIFQKD